MVKLSSFVLAQLRKPFLCSALQMALAGAILYILSMYFAPNYACGAGNVDLAKGIFTCLMGTMAWGYKTLIVLGMAMASLSLGRAVSLMENRVERSR